MSVLNKILLCMATWCGLCLDLDAQSVQSGHSICNGISALFCSGCWRGDFEVFFWRPSTDSGIIAVSQAETSGFTETTVFTPFSDYDVGYRWGLYHRVGCLPVYIGGWVAWLNAKHTFRGEPLPDSLFFLSNEGDALSSFKSSQTQNYITADLELGHWLEMCDCRGRYHALRPFLFVAARFVDIRFNGQEVWDLEDPSTPGQTTLSDGQTRFHGVGPRMGLGVEWALWRCLSLHTKVAVSFLFTNRSMSVFSVSNEAPVFGVVAQPLEGKKFQHSM